jgi:peptidyl-prolyl cis-trans isomerase B (cyclophilin B)
VAGSKRERDLHRQKLARQQREAAEAAERRRRRLMIGGPILAVLLVVGGVAAAAIVNSNSDDSSTSASAPDPAANGALDANPTPPPAASGSVELDCSKVNDKKPEKQQYDAVDNELREGSTYFETMTTNCGEITFDLFAESAPETTKAITFLSDRGFYDNTVCHRLTTEGIFVLQCGDPDGNGTGGPGFTIPDENLPEAEQGGQAIYERGTVAMANSGPGTSGSQFFLVYEDSPLPPNYTVFGQITSGLDILDAIAAEGTANGAADGAPKQPVQITKMISSVTFPVAP